MKVHHLIDTSWFEDSKSYLKCSDLIFSKETYQLTVWDEQIDNHFITFIQFEEEDSLSDAFCNCDHEGEDACDHIKFSLNTIFNEHSEPLHVRFESSFSNHLFQILSSNYGYFPHISYENQNFLLEDRNNRVFLQLHSHNEKGQKYLKSLLIDREKETEENSLKFSKLSSEELNLYRSGRPSKNLSYELSVWSDLAKVFFLKAERKKTLTVNFEETQEELPHSLSFTAPNLDMTLDLDEEVLKEVLPYLEFVESNLKVFSSQQVLDSIIYKPETGSLNLQYTSKSSSLVDLSDVDEKEGIKFGRWLYLPNKGFLDSFDIQKDDSKEIPAEEVLSFISENTLLMKKHLKDYSFRRQESSAQYSVSFDEDWNLTVDAFLFEKGDLLKGSSRIFDGWVFIEDSGFYKVRNIRESLIGTFQSSDVEEFVEQHRLWIGQFEGFSFHISSFETSLDYSFDIKQGLKFYFFSSAKDEHKIRYKDFGKWIYFENQGFFSKQSTTHLQFLSGKTIEVDKVADFITDKKELLCEIPDLYIEENPVKKVGLKINYKNGDIQLEPHVSLFSRWEDKKALFLGKVVYIEGKGFFTLPKKDHIPDEYLKRKRISSKEWDHFFSYDFPVIKKHLISSSKELSEVRNFSLQLENFKKLKKKKGRAVQVNLSLASPIGVISIDEVIAAINNKQLFLPSSAGLLDLRDPSLKSLYLLKDAKVSPDSSTLDLSYFDFFKLIAMTNLELSPQISPKDEESFRSIFEFVDDVPYDLSLLNGNLRPYQKHGLEWLWFLYQNELSGLLCDDMGLGKTHQVMALLSAALFEKQKAKILIVCPTSVLYHWKVKLEGHIPSGKVCFYHGTSRKATGIDEEAAIILTSYGICRQEKEAFSKIAFDIAIYDEVQVAKNHHSRIYKSLLEFSAKFKVGLTGTPIENSLMELRSVFDLVLPNYLPREAEFKRRFIDPIERFSDERQKQQLHRLVAPFLLRRKKEEVLSDLPSKVEEKLICELSKDQVSFYNKLINTYKQGLVNDLKDDAKNVSYIHVFALLTKLKQICDHPSVFLGNVDEYKKYHSGKFEAFKDIVQQARYSGQKVVVFSQYLGMLDIIQKYLEEQRIDFAGIRGSTINRDKQLEKFNNKDSCSVFLASLQASGVGIDLTAASCVIHYDRWWNPAKENQATDRVHRIGQTKGVQVFKLICRGSLEERIDALISKKQALIDDLIQSSEESILRTLNRDELIELLDLAHNEA
ncbi:MAG: DEAD/DEAH box helicase [Chlamydiales bacterium]|nr:DEAD/DEAH box helicase [Chlamydiales bacterium]